MNAEEVKVGCFQAAIVILLGVNYVIVAMSHALPVFHNYTPKFYCQARNSTNRTYGCLQTDDLSLSGNLTSGLHESPVSCLGDYQFATESGENSVVTEWSLICEKRYLTFLGPTVYYVGVMMGAWIAGLLADRIGRLPVQAICLYTQGTMAVALYVVQNYPAFLALRGLQGVFVQGLQNSTYILSLELFPAKSRTFVALVMQISWAIGLILLAVLSYVIPDWRILQLAVSVPTAVTVLYIWIIPESPRWLLAKGKSTEADMAFERIAKYNACCTRSRRENDTVKVEESANESIVPVKPERKSRASSVDLRKTRNDGETKEEADNLLSNPEAPQQKARKSGLRTTNPENEEVKEIKDKPEEPPPRNENGDTEKKETPSSSKTHRKSKSISQTTTNQRQSLKNAYEIVELRTPPKKERMDDQKKSICKVEEKLSVQNEENLKDLLKCRLPRKYGIVMACQWFTSTMACYLFTTLVPNFPVSRHITFALGGALEIAIYVFLYFVLSRYGRRLPMSVYQSFCGFICILLAALIILSSPAVWVDLAKSIVLLFGRVAVTSTIAIAYLYTVEIFPTVLRGTCLGLCAVFAKIGSLCTPHVLLSGEYVTVAVPLIIIGMSCMISGALALLLPETLSKILPDTIEDSELLVVDTRKKNEESPNNEKTEIKEDLTEREILRAKLFSEDWVDAGNGILVNFSENKTSD